jgi:arylsulfatase A-like enzyme
MDRRLSHLLCLAALAAATAAPLRAADRPNVLVLISDDQRFDALAALGNGQVQTPHMDGLVRRGFTFTHAFCMGSTVDAVCAPSRAMLMTGRTLYHTPIEIPNALPIWPEVMRRAGYTTFATGKWHNGPASFARGFGDGAAIFFGGMANHLRVPVHDFDPSGRYDEKDARIGNAFSSELFADAAIGFLRKHPRDKPFFLYTAFTAPHDPRMPPKEYAARYDPNRIPLPRNFLPQHPFDNGELKVRDELLAPWPRTPEEIKRHLADYYGMITHLDAQIGRILQALEETGQAQNTVIVFTSDHGLAIGSHGLLGKQNLYDHSMRPPLILAGPGVPPGGKSDALCYLLDLFPTVCELTGVPAPPTVEGKSLVPILTGKEPRVRDSVFGAYRDVQRMVRTEDWKLIRYPRINKTQLFDVRNDPDELHDLAGDPGQAGRVKEMTALLREWQQKLDDKQPLNTER